MPHFIAAEPLPAHAHVAHLPADAFDVAFLTALWNRAYAGYFVPIAFSVDQFARHVARSGIDLALSIVAVDAHGDPIGLSLAAREGREAWIGGFGVAAEHRRRGHARALIDAQIRVLARTSVSRVRLEVIDANRARDVYRGAGFVEARRLLVLDGALPRGHGEPGLVLETESLEAAHRALHTREPVWRRRWPPVARTLSAAPLTCIGIARADRLAAYALVWPTPEGKLAITDAAAADVHAATSLMHALAVRWPGMPARLIDEPETSPVARAWQDAGFTSPIVQIEMERDMASPSRGAA